MQMCLWPMPVRVVAYIRLRFGKIEHVRAHCRSMPKR